MWHVYILKCNDGSYYTGISSDVEKRVETHNSGKGSEYTKSRRPVVLCYKKQFDNKKAAELRETEIKRLSKKNKEKLIRFGT